ncbi:MAG: hypothetical protein KAG66_11925, partial [Methylococcales bacterium]|nr:hypothetical protein [Methylococcales bacterium]
YDNSMGLTHYFYGDGNAAPSTLPYPGAAPPLYAPFPGGNPVLPALRSNFRNLADPIHLDYDEYQYKITNQTINYFLPKWRENPTVTFRSQGGGNDGWADGVKAGTNSIKIGDDSTNLTQGIVSFDTASLPDNAIITSASLYILRDSATGENPFTGTFLGNPVVDVISGTFGTAAVEASDATAPATASNAGCVHGSVKDAYYGLRVDLQSTGLSAINNSGLTQIRLGFETIDVDTDQIDFFDGDATLLVGEERIVEKIVTRRQTLPDGSSKVVTNTILAITHQGLAEVMGSPAPFLDVTYCTPPNAPDVAISEVGGAVELSWTPIGNAESYEVWSAVNDPYFVPSGDCALATNCVVESGNVSMPAHDIGNPIDNYYYTVIAVNSCGGGATSPLNNAPHTAHFDFSITAGTP